MTPEEMTPEQLKKFLVYYRKRIDRYPDNVEARLRLATVHRELGQRPRAIEQYEAAAQLLDEQGLALEAIAACKAILELDPSRVEAQYFLARLYAQTPDATDTSARVARPVEIAEESDPHESDREADHLTDTQEWQADGELPDRPDEEPTRVADSEQLADDWSDTDEDDSARIELTPEERQRREGFSREEMEDLLTTIDVDPEDIVEIEDVDEAFDEGFADDLQDTDPGRRSESADFELGEELEVDEDSG